MSENNRIKRVLLFNPPDRSLLNDSSAAAYSYCEPPLGLLYVYDYLRSIGCVEVHILDCNVEMRASQQLSTLEQFISDALERLRPDLVCIAALYYSDIPVFNRMANSVKAASPNCLVAMGGHYPSHLTAKCLENPDVDFAILSEGELGVAGLIDALNSRHSLADVEGLAWREGDVLHVSSRKTFWKDFVSHVRLPWEDIPFSSYFIEGRSVLERVFPREALRVASMTASRGCPNRCAFCSSPSFWQRHWRKRKVSNIINEIRYLQDNYGVNTIVFNDENIGVDRRWFLELLDAMTPLGITWISSGGLSLRSINDDEVIDKMFASGIGLFNLAIESGSDSTLERVYKPLTTRETRQTVERIRANGDSYLVGFFILGFPFESWADIETTVSFADSLDLDWKSFYCFQPFPGSSLYQYCLENKMIEEFNVDYKEVYFSADINYSGFTAKQLGDFSYSTNLRLNFLKNRNLVRGDEESLKQVEKDFRYVLSISPDHVFALHGLAQVAQLKGDSFAAEGFLAKARKALSTSPAIWAQHVKSCSIDLKGSL